MNSILKVYIKKIAYKFFPPVFWDLLKFAKKQFNKWVKFKRHGWLLYDGFNGIYETWEEASQFCGSYDSDLILEKCKQSLLKVKRGEAVYERDSVVFDKIQYSWPLTSGLLYATNMSNSKLNVLDFGGSLGSTYYQNRNFLKGIKHFSWSIVEQSNFVQVGKKYFKDDVLNFYDSIESCISDKNRKINVFLASSSFPYIKDPFALIKRIIQYEFPYIIIDRTYFIDLPKSVVSIQRVPAEIYKVSYPAWFFNFEEFISLFQTKYDLVTDFYSYLQATNKLEGVSTREKGMIFELRRSL
ncbi:TIGR04325 family methyltransferase [Leptospira kirschneri]|uniref:TIGR04325 family methyltransferase n=1 Tax=Leptospira kirschneri TaxID=29507 RepID=UPI0002FA13FB|nr:TIGR04325 family methyltransferase [Leptospira kirschneri]KPZ77472.1 methyltransferase [Leptospira kirschneri serovar Mozdok]NDK05767.1 Methyltransferase, TIGR04325 family [Leptospira kirschneri serovar Mozdok]